MFSRNLKDFRTFVKEREFFVLENKVNFSEKIEPKDVKELRRLVKNKKNSFRKYPENFRKKAKELGQELF